MGDVGRARQLLYAGRRKENKDDLATWVKLSISLSKEDRDLKRRCEPSQNQLFYLT